MDEKKEDNSVQTEKLCPASVEICYMQNNYGKGFLLSLFAQIFFGHKKTPPLLMCRIDKQKILPVYSSNTWMWPMYRAGYARIQLSKLRH
jgi:hypothetical protein